WEIKRKTERCIPVVVRPYPRNFARHEWPARRLVSNTLSVGTEVPVHCERRIRLAFQSAIDDYGRIGIISLGLALITGSRACHRSQYREVLVKVCFAIARQTIGCVWCNPCVATVNT